MVQGAELDEHLKAIEQIHMEGTDLTDSDITEADKHVTDITAVIKSGQKKVAALKGVWKS